MPLPYNSCYVYPEIVSNKQVQILCYCTLVDFSGFRTSVLIFLTTFYFNSLIILKISVLSTSYILKLVTLVRIEWHDQYYFLSLCNTGEKV